MAEKSGAKNETEGKVKDRWGDLEEWRKPEYGTSWVRNFPNGHQERVDFKHGYSRHQVKHPSGTGFETVNDGSTKSITVANKWDYTKGGTTNTVDGNNDAKTGGHDRSSTIGGKHSEYLGQKHEVQAGSQPHTKLALQEQKIAAPTVTISASQKITLIAPIIDISATTRAVFRAPTVHIFGYNDLVMNSGSRTDINSGGPIKIKGATITAWGEPINLNP